MPCCFKVTCSRLTHTATTRIKNSSPAHDVSYSSLETPSVHLALSTVRFQKKDKTLNDQIHFLLLTKDKIKQFFDSLVKMSICHKKITHNTKLIGKIYHLDTIYKKRDFHSMPPLIGLWCRAQVFKRFRFNKLGWNFCSHFYCFYPLNC
jgi:hypothetical protein